MRLFLCIYSIMCCFLFQAQSLEDIAFQALEQLENDKAKRALSIASKGLKQYPESHELMLLTGRANEQLGDLDGAFKFYSEAITQKPDYTHAYMKRGSIYVKIKDMSNCIADYTSAIEFAETDSLKYWAMSNRGTCYHYNQQLDLALKDQKAVFLSDSMDIFNINNYATILDYFDPKEAIRQLKRMVEIDPEFMGSYINLGFQLGEIGEYQEAEKYLRLGLEKVPEDAFMLNNLGFTQFKQGNHQEAINSINKSLRFNNANSYAYRNLSLVYLDIGDMQAVCANIILALNNGFSKLYGDEMKKLHAAHCL